MSCIGVSIFRLVCKVGGSYVPLLSWYTHILLPPTGWSLGQMRARSRRVLNVLHNGSDIEARFSSWVGTPGKIADGWPTVPVSYKKNFNVIDRFNKMLSSLPFHFDMRHWRGRIINTLVTMSLCNAWVLWQSRLTEGSRVPLTTLQESETSLRHFVQEVAQGFAKELPPSRLGQHLDRSSIAK